VTFHYCDVCKDVRCRVYAPSDLGWSCRRFGEWLLGPTPGFAVAVQRHPELPMYSGTVSRIEADESRVVLVRRHAYKRHPVQAAIRADYLAIIGREVPP